MSDRLEGDAGQHRCASFRWEGYVDIRSGGKHPVHEQAAVGLEIGLPRASARPAHRQAGRPIVQAAEPARKDLERLRRKREGYGERFFNSLSIEDSCARAN